jgi:hypothetical protein
VWQDGPRAYAVTVDNTELHDVDIFDITNPRDPKFIAEHDLAELSTSRRTRQRQHVFQHDMVVKRIDGA